MTLAFEPESLINVMEPAGAPCVTTTLGNVPEPLIGILVTLVPVDALVNVTVAVPDSVPEANPDNVPLNVPFVGAVPPVPVYPTARLRKSVATSAALAPVEPAV